MMQWMSMLIIVHVMYMHMPTIYSLNLGSLMFVRISLILALHQYPMHRGMVCSYMSMCINSMDQCLSIRIETMMLAVVMNNSRLWIKIVCVRHVSRIAMHSSARISSVNGG